MSRPRTTTQFLAIDPDDPAPAAIARAVAVLRDRRLVAFPTETVYGLGADARSDVAVARIFAAKRRPASNPLIVHVADINHARQLVTDWPDSAQQLARRFWPGPLTLVLPRQPEVSDLVTAGGPTVGLRMPAHPVALELLRGANLPVAAPSANLATHISPTRAEHVRDDLEGRVDLILDGGSCRVGIESTVVDLSGAVPRLLRPGAVSHGELEDCLGTTVEGKGRDSGLDRTVRSPGQQERHYAPSIPTRCVDSEELNRTLDQARVGERIGYLAREGGTSEEVTAREGIVLRMSSDPRRYAAELYAALRTLEASDVDWIVIERPPRQPEWEAVHDRLLRASAS
ncbi:Threonylcarbamoyl-AMP synthase [Planctomycetes bacterium Pan216]|uniref:Threonylcarbamoyl-AMP synthase n=1 Tax=Kolteria novifilia TaxID=2527975 RepID=A0A518BCF9_9BACT|nr:Threonylcarbamoyl-AMP synthase [Planctomycetes bacterium Pan216]